VSNDGDNLDALLNTPEDLAANRSGRLGTGQRRRLRAEATGNIIAYESVLGSVVGAVYLSIDEGMLRHVIAGVIGLLGLVVALRAHRDHFAAARAGTVECVTGLVSVGRRGIGSSLTVRGRSLRLPAVPPGLDGTSAYHVYVAPAARMVLAVEPVTVVAAPGPGEPAGADLVPEGG
jgi:hypothetical protein